MSIRQNTKRDLEAFQWSQRLPERLQETEFSRRFSSALSDDALDLRSSNPTTAELARRADCLQAYRSVLDDDRIEPYRPSPAGMRKARTAICRYYEQRGASVSPNDVILCASTSEAYTWLAKVIGDAGDSIAVPSPSYPLFEHLLGVESIEPAPYPASFDGHWHTDVGALRELIDDRRPNALIDVSPNNPTGHRLRGDMLESVADLACQQYLPLIVDEVFLDYPRSNDSTSSILGPLQNRPADRRPPTVVLSGLSKVAGLPGAKVGWMILDGPENWRDDLRKRLLFVADTFLSVTTASQLAVPAVLESIEPFQRELNDRLAVNASAVQRLISQIEVASRRSGQHGWYELIRLPHTVSSRDLALSLIEDFSVAVQPGFLYDLPETTLVVSLLPEPEAFRKGLDRIRTGLIDTYNLDIT